MKHVCSVLTLAFALTASASADTFTFSNGTPNGLMAMASRPGSSGVAEIEAADDFVLTSPTTITSASFYGLLPSLASTVTAVNVEIYRVFPLDSTVPPSGNVLTRTNSPSDVAFAERDSPGDLSFSTPILASSFTASNSVVNGINKFPNQTTGGEGAVTGAEVLFTVNFSTPFTLLPDHYFFVPQVQLSSGNFLWLSSTRPNPALTPDLQAWIRNDNLDPDWLRVGTDIVGGTSPPTFNGAFSLAGTTAAPTPEPSTFVLLLTGSGLLLRRLRTS
jgi:hypothetical protein